MEQERNQIVGTAVFTVPNALSAFRLLMVPVFLVLIVQEQDLVALIVLAASSFTDFLDGVIARRFGQVTRLGQLLDPAADRLFIFATLIGLAARGIVPWWLVAVIIGRDVVLLATGVVLANADFGPLPVHHLGKLATFCLLYALPMLMVGEVFPQIAATTDPLGWAFGLWGAFLYWWAALLYVRETARVVRIPRAEGGARSDTLER